MPILRITKRYNNASPLVGMFVNDKVPFNSHADGNAWVKAVQENKTLDWDLVDYEWALITHQSDDKR